MIFQGNLRGYLDADDCIANATESYFSDEAAGDLLRRFAISNIKQQKHGETWPSMPSNLF